MENLIDYFANTAKSWYRNLHFTDTKYCTVAEAHVEKAAGNERVHVLNFEVSALHFHRIVNLSLKVSCYKHSVKSVCACYI